MITPVFSILALSSVSRLRGMQSWATCHAPRKFGVMDTQPDISTPAPTRHGCLTTFLVVTILLDLVAVFLNATSGEAMRQTGFRASLAVIGVLTFCAAANIIFAIALFRWWRWGFYGFIVTTTLAVVTNLYVGLGTAVSLVGLVRVAILYWVLNMGGANRAWTRLK